MWFGDWWSRQWRTRNQVDREIPCASEILPAESENSTGGAMNMKMVRKMQYLLLRIFHRIRILNVSEYCPVSSVVINPAFFVIHSYCERTKGFNWRHLRWMFYSAESSLWDRQTEFISERICGIMEKTFRKMVLCNLLCYRLIMVNGEII